MHCILCGDFVRRFVSLDGFQGYPRLQFRAVSLPLSGQQFSPFDTSLDTAILPYPPVHFSGTIIISLIVRCQICCFFPLLFVGVVPFAATGAKLFARSR